MKEDCDNYVMFKIFFDAGGPVSITDGPVLTNEQFMHIRKVCGGFSCSSMNNDYICDRKELIECIESEEFKRIGYE